MQKLKQNEIITGITIKIKVPKNAGKRNILPKKFFGDEQEQFENRIFQFYNDLKENYHKYHLESTLKYSNEEKKEQFLFRDKQVIDVYDSKNKGKLTINFDENENCNVVRLEKEDNNLFEEISDFILSMFALC